LAIGSAFQKFRRKVLKPVAKIAAVVPGPWQAPASYSNKAEAGYNIAKGEGGIGELMTIGGRWLLKRYLARMVLSSNLGKATLVDDAGNSWIL
jgi:hypothetical protein